MQTHQIAVIAGDGVGQEIIPEAKRLLAELQTKHGFRLEYQDYPWGSDYYLQHGSMAPAGFLHDLRKSEAILLGAVGHPKVPDHITLNGLLLPIRRTFDQYANIRPAKLYKGVASPLALRKGEQIDLVVVRENTEGEYAQVGGFVYSDQPQEVAIQTSVFTRRGVERVVRVAFKLARERNRKRKVTSVTKSNAQGYSLVLWDRAFAAVAEEFPDIATESLLVDAAAMNFIRRPESFDVVVASNLFGDILSDISAMIIGSMGLAPSANLDPSRRNPSMFEPVHGSAPDIAFKGIVNPLATFLCLEQMLQHLGHAAAAADIARAITSVLADTDVRTPDLGGN
ncbi:MAG: tartrate dehydrogenase/decarboxylase / D-malate dehydrogenase, partial [Bryobacterales bacterium]|nr:tartrate dehydrogenase/decarboxylase / D-malate dehydrogenase [Bryobacterales bacterium]